MPRQSQKMALAVSIFPKVLPASTYVFDKSRIRGSKNKKLHFVADLQFKREETRLNLVPIGHWYLQYLH